MLVLSEFVPQRDVLLPKFQQIQADIEGLYKAEYDTFEGRNVNPSALQQREDHYRTFFNAYL